MSRKLRNKGPALGSRAGQIGMKSLSISDPTSRDGSRVPDRSVAPDSRCVRPSVASKRGSSASVNTAIHLPSELLIQIISYIPLSPSGQKTLHSCCLLSHEWYAAAIFKLYERPYIDGRNFEKFAATVCPPLGSHVRRIELATYVKHLDLSCLIHHSSKSLNARLLGRVKNSIETFRGPVTSFG